MPLSDEPGPPELFPVDGGSTTSVGGESADYYQSIISQKRTSETAQ